MLLLGKGDLKIYTFQAVKKQGSPHIGRDDGPQRAMDQLSHRIRALCAGLAWAAWSTLIILTLWCQPWFPLTQKWFASALEKFHLDATS